MTIEKDPEMGRLVEQWLDDAEVGRAIREARVACACGHDHQTVTLDGTTSVFHRCRAKGCDCNEFRPEPPDIAELLNDAGCGAELAALLAAYRDSVAHTTRWEHASQTRRVCPELADANKAEGEARAAIEARISDLAADRARLNWLDGLGRDIACGIERIEVRGKVTIGSADFVWRNYAWFGGESVRDAIDAARATTPEETPAHER